VIALLSGRTAASVQTNRSRSPRLRALSFTVVATGTVGDLRRNMMAVLAD
jgi:hypothetical protein